MPIKIPSTLLFIISSVSVCAQNAELFIKEDWGKALELAKESGKPIVVDFYTEWCGWCVEMEKKTFQDSAVAIRLENEVIALKLDAERGIGREVAMKYRIHSFPTVGYFHPNGKLIKKIPGFKEPAAFLEDLNFVAEYISSEQEDPYPGISSDMNPGFPEMYTNSFGPNGKRKFPTKEEVQMWFSNHKSERKSEVYFSMLYKFISYCDEETKAKFLNNRTTYSALYGSDDVLSIIENIISTRFYKLVQDKNSIGFDSLIAELPMYLSDEQKIAESKNHLQLLFYSKTENYEALTKLIEDNIITESINNYNLNDYAWSIYQKCENVEVLEKALKWMETVVQKEPTFMYLDTYASLAFKLKKYTLAKEFAQKAIDEGVKSGDNIADTEKLLKEISEEMK
ncbi:MAG: hypothetical protein RLZZ337_1296 [Bacteroidota bacterium]|jgi:thioredoxin-related protein